MLIKSIELLDLIDDKCFMLKEKYYNILEKKKYTITEAHRDKIEEFMEKYNEEDKKMMIDLIERTELMLLNKKLNYYIINMYMIGETFGFTNGIITILALITGLHATKVNKIGIIGAILALLITDPLCDLYALYTSQKIIDKKTAYSIGFNAFLSQFLLQLLFLMIIIYSDTVEKGVYYCYIVGIILTLLYDKYNNLLLKESFVNVVSILILVLITYYINTYVYKHFD